MVIDLLKYDIKFGDIPSKNIIYIKKKFISVDKDAMRDAISELEEMVEEGGGYDKLITEIKSDRERDEDLLRELQARLEDD
jgi:hypothetical protein